MFRACTASVALLLASAAEANDSIRYRGLSVGQQFEIKTDRAVYHGKLVNPKTGECQMRMGLADSRLDEPQTVYLLGATQGRQAKILLVRMHEVQVGMSMELGIGGLADENRYITSPVREVKLLESK